MKRKICLGYLCAVNKSTDVDKTLNSLDFSKLTHIAVAFAKIKQNNNNWIPCITENLSDTVHKLKDKIKSQNADTKIILSVGGAFADGFCQASRTAENRHIFANELIKIIDNLQVDGADIDWEFPGSSMLGIESCKNCKKDYILLLTEIKRQLKGRLLTAAVGSNRYIGTDVKSLAEIADYVFVMTYDLGIAHSDIFLTKIFVTMWKLSGVPSSKLCIGVPFYGKNVKHLDETKPFNYLMNGKIINRINQSYAYIDDKKWCFDTPYDIRKKGIWANKNGLGGIFCWELSTDFNNQLLTAMHNGINIKNE